MTIAGSKILVTGATSQVGLPVVRALASEGTNDVHGLARLRKTEDRERLEKMGVVPLPVDLATDDLGAVAEDYDYVIHLAIVKSGNFDYDMAATVEGLGRLMHRCRNARAFLHGSSAAVYDYTGSDAIREDAPLGDNHRSLFPTYSICKIAAESMARFAALQWQLPTIIARFSVPYGDAGGWPSFHLAMMQAGMAIPVHPDRPNHYNLLHEDDYIAQLPSLLNAAAVPAVTINWGGERASLEEWCTYLGELAGLEARFEETTNTIPPLPVDTGRMREITGECTVGWREGMRRIVAHASGESGASSESSETA